MILINFYYFSEKNISKEILYVIDYGNKYWKNIISIISNISLLIYLFCIELNYIRNEYILHKSKGRSNKIKKMI